LVPFGSKIPSGLAVVSLKLQPHSSSKNTYSGPALTRKRPSHEAIWQESGQTLRGACDASIPAHLPLFQPLHGLPLPKVLTVHKVASGGTSSKQVPASGRLR